MASSKVESVAGFGDDVTEPKGRLGAASSEPSSGDLCTKCATPLVVIRLDIDGNVLLMESCETCDIRSWRLDGTTIDRAAAIAEVGERAGRRR